ncbi:hypothetical protein BRC93_09540 [Halobacteriales archaeon QS_5_70_15]|nr:MAG: hypothetical protein BRC93_09540 [Halobacteriales archaeon QS_5_70_15]
MSSSDGGGSGSPGGTEAQFVRTAGLDPAERGGIPPGSDGEAARAEAERLRDRVSELEAELQRREAALDAREGRIEELEIELESIRSERDDAREWAAFLGRELSECRGRVGTLEDRVETLESRGLLDRFRGLFG